MPDLYQWAADPRRHADTLPTPLRMRGGFRFAVGELPMASIAAELASAGVARRTALGTGLLRNGEPVSPIRVTALIAEHLRTMATMAEAYTADDRNDDLAAANALDLSALRTSDRTKANVFRTDADAIRDEWHAVSDRITALRNTAHDIATSARSRSAVLAYVHDHLPLHAPDTTSADAALSAFLHRFSHVSRISRPTLHAAYVDAGEPGGATRTELYARAAALFGPARKQHGTYYFIPRPAAGALSSA